MKRNLLFVALAIAVVIAALFVPEGQVMAGAQDFGPEVLLGMTTLAANLPRAFEGGNRNDLPMIAADIIYEGACVGVVAASGHARPIAATDLFAGFAEAKADNSAGAAAAINVRVITSGEIQLPVTGAVITSYGLPVYAVDDNSFTMTASTNVFIGYVKRFVSTGVAVVAFNAGASRSST